GRARLHERASPGTPRRLQPLGNVTLTVLIGAVLIGSTLRRRDHGRILRPGLLVNSTPCVKLPIHGCEIPTPPWKRSGYAETRRGTAALQLWFSPSRPPRMTAP